MKVSHFSKSHASHTASITHKKFKFETNQHRLNSSRSVFIELGKATKAQYLLTRNKECGFYYFNKQPESSFTHIHFLNCFELRRKLYRYHLPWLPWGLSSADDAMARGSFAWCCHQVSISRQPSVSWPRPFLSGIGLELKANIQYSTSGNDFVLLCLSNIVLSI